MKKFISVVIVFFLIFTFYSCKNLSKSSKENSSSNNFRNVDYNKIEPEINNQSSRFYYPKLMERLKIFDTTLTADEYFYLYYGYTCQDSYSPYFHSGYSETFHRLLREPDSPQVNDSIIEYAKLILEQDPFELSNYSIIAYLNDKKGNTEIARRYGMILYGIIEAMLSSGDGLSEKTAIYVIDVSNEYDLIRIMGYGSVESQALTRSGCDAMSLKGNKNGIDILYFNVNRLLEIENKILRH